VRALSVVRRPGVAQLLAATGLGRLPISMMPLAILLVLRRGNYGYGFAGGVLAAFAAGVAAGHPLSGHAIDRGATLLPRMAFVFSAAAVLFAGLVALHAPAPLLVLASGVAGASLPPLGPSMRAAWPVLLSSHEDRAAAYTLEALLQELPILTGPLLVAACAELGSPEVGVIAAAGCGTCGALVFERLAPRARKDSPSPAGAVNRRAGTQIRAVLLVVAASAAAGGAVEVALPAFAEGHGARTDAGLLLSSVAVGSLLSGVWGITRKRQGTPVARYRRALAAASVVAWILMVPQTIAAMVAAAVLVGVPIPPTFAAVFVLLSRDTHSDTRTRTFGWLTSTVFIGQSFGDVTTGWCVHAVSLQAALSLVGTYDCAALVIALLWLSHSR
jgi:hypothetical protein